MASPSLLTNTLLLLATFAFFAPSCFSDDVMYSGDIVMSYGDILSYGNYVLTFRDDCRLVLYDNGQEVWSSSVLLAPPIVCIVVFHTNGDLEVYDPTTGFRQWHSDSGGQEGKYVLVLQHDRNLVIYGGAIWGAGTNTVGTAVVISGNSTKPAEVAGYKITMVTGK
ncbi:hypothetical protein LUZ61_015397 [Rhynchospora tenuis]|uniref:non-specific serine/threonine protein kinase n=1 Tax=Rhynchospora tenuis TaxID=198213 RepID=A0AAD5WEE7_9POAL|nr:hypothetical protein LUZ61_015397 [Rhynchospora tenuis]